MGKIQDYIIHLPKVRYVYGRLQVTLGKTGLHENGWFKSIWTDSSVDKHGGAIPWITYPCIYYLEKTVPKKAKVFEYGSGNSTLWWSKRTTSLTSIEYDRFWYERVSKDLPKNVELHHYELKNGYEKAVNKTTQKYDIIVIDGRKRNECAKNSLLNLSSKGVIIWDNTNRAKYRKGMDYLKKQGFKRLDFFGMGPLSPKNSLTTIFYRSDNILGI
jgi:hypothetical protein